jgi:hypothetical protein
MDTQQNISSTFSTKSDLILSEIMKKNNLNGEVAEILLTKFTMFFSRGEISEKEMIDSIQKEIEVSQKTAEQIVEEIKNNLIPTLWDKMLQGGEKSVINDKKIEKKDYAFEKIKKPLNVVEAMRKKTSSARIESNDKITPKLNKKEKIKKPTTQNDVKKFVPKPSRHSGLDTYREPIE